MYAWLRDNKIVFETVTAALLSLMAIIVSVAQALVSYRQAKLQELQTKLAEAQALPQFTPRLSQEFDAASGKFVHNHLIVSNHGGFVSEFEADSAQYLIITLTQDGQSKRAELPITGYFSATFISSGGTGELVTFKGFHNTEKEIEIERTVREIAHLSNEFATVDVRIIVRLRYKDLLGRVSRDYFDVKPVTGTARLPTSVGDDIFEHWFKGKLLEFSKLSAEEILRLTRAGEN